MLTLKILSPDGVKGDVSCDSITLTVRDNEKGKGGGSYGIRTGHASSVIATDSGFISARLRGETVFSESFPGGTAFVADNTVTVLTE